MFSIPTGGGKDSSLPHPTGGGKDSLLPHPTGGGKDSSFPHPTGGGKDSECTVSYCIYSRSSSKGEQPKSGKQVKAFSASVEKFRRASFDSKLDCRRIQTTLQGAPKIVQDSLHNQRILRSKQTKCLVDCYSRLNSQRRNRHSAKTRQPRILQPSVPGPKTRKPMEASNRSKLPQQISGHIKVQDGNPRVHTSFPQKERVGHLDRPHRRLPSHPHSSSLTKVPPVPPQRRLLTVHQPSVRPSYSPLDLHQCSEGGQTFGLATGNTHSPIPGRLAGSRPLQGGVPQTNPKVVEPNPGFGFYSELQEVRTGTFPEVRFSGLPFFARFGACQAHARQVDEASGYVPSPLVKVCYQCKDSYVHHWITCINGEDSQTGQDAYETFSMASLEDSLEISDASGYSNPLESEDDTTRGMVVRPQKRATRRVSPPKGTRKTYLYRRLKRRLGRALRSRLNRRGLVSHRKSSPHQPFGIKGSSPSATVLQDHLQEQSRSHCLGQHLRSVLHKQTGRHKIRRTLRSNVENSDMVQSQQRHTQSKTHTRIPQCDSGWPLKEEPDPKHRVVAISTSFQTNIKDMGKSPSGPFCNQAEHKTPLVRLSDPGPPSLGSRRLEHSMGESGCIRFSPNRPPAQGYTETPVTNVQASSDRPRLAIKTMVLGPSGNVAGRTSTVTSNANLTQTTNEQHFPLQPGLPQPPRLVSRSTALQQRGFTAEVADRIAAPQRLSTRAIYTSKWSVFQRWCMEQQVDFRSPSIGDICNFFWYLFHDLNRCPSTIEGYRTAIADTLGNSDLNIGSNTDIARLIASFYRDKPKKSRPLPKWDLALVLHKLTQPPFEPQEECTLKLTTWKTVFLLALASGKRHSEIHAWTHDGTLCLGNWEQVQLTPSPSFIAKNQLAKEGPHIVSPVIIPALKSDQDSQNLDILLCPVRALKQYLDRTKDSRTGRHLLFISYKLGHSKDIQCSTISSWIKHTIQFCYSRAESTDMVLTGVKAHDIRAFAASKAFYGGASLDQIMQACQWRSHNTFTKFYLKDLTGQDQKEGSYHLGSFVAAQQVMPPSS